MVDMLITLSRNSLSLWIHISHHHADNLSCSFIIQLYLNKAEKF